MNVNDDYHLLRQYAASGSDAAFATLVSRHINLVYSVAVRQLQDHHQAEEVTQAVFIILAKKAATLSPKTILSGWLCRTARYVAANTLTIQRRRQRREQEAFMESTLSESDESDAVVWQQISPLLDDALNTLAAGEHNAIVLRFMEGKNFKQVGAALGTDEDAARMRVNRGLEKLRKFFTKRGVGLTAAIIAGTVTTYSVQAAPAGLAKTVTAVAIGKGAAASGSTLILVKGALKLMAWAKAKTAIAVTSITMLASIGTIASVNHFIHSPPNQSGRLKMANGNVRPMIAFSYSRTAILLASDGSLWSWGEDRLGWPVFGLQDTNIHHTTALRRIGHDADWVSISAGDSHCLGIKSDGTLWGWGGNFDSQLGDGTKRTRPTPVPSVPGNDWKQAAAGGAASYALKNDGTLWAWGNNWAGQLGVGNTNEGNEARQVGTATNWVKVWAGSIQTLGLQSDGTLWFWGSLTGDSQDIRNFPIPTRVSADTNWTDVCFGYFTMFGLKSDGTLWSWGRQAGFYTHTDAATPTLTPMQVGQENDWQSCSGEAGGFYELLMKKDGSLWALDASEHRIVKPASEYKPVKLQRIDFKKDITTYAAGMDNIGIVLTRDGEVWTWGSVLGELTPKDYWDAKGRPLHPKARTIEEPWQLSFIDSF